MKYNSALVNYIKSLPLSEEYQRIFGEPLPRGKMFCPFHENTNTPAAKVYGNVIKCFSCNRVYTTFDLLMRYDRERITQISRTVFPKTFERELPKKVTYAPRESLELGKGVSVELFDYLANYPFQ